MLPKTKIIRKNLLDALNEVGTKKKLANIEQLVQSLTAVRRVAWSVFIEPDINGQAVYIGSCWSPAPLFLSSVYQNVLVYVEGSLDFLSYKVFLNKVCPNVVVRSWVDVNGGELGKKYALVVFDHSMQKASQQRGKSIIKLFYDADVKQLIWIADNKFGMLSIKQQTKKYLAKLKASSRNEFESKAHMRRHISAGFPLLQEVKSYAVAPNSTFVKHLYFSNTNSVERLVGSLFSKMLEKVCGSNGYFIVAQRPSSKAILDEVLLRVQKSVGAIERPHVDEAQVLETGVVILFSHLCSQDVVLRIFMSTSSVERSDAAYRSVKLFAANFAWSRPIVPTLITEGDVGGIKYSCEKRLPGVLGIEMLSDDVLQKEIANTALTFLVKISRVPALVDAESQVPWDYQSDIEKKISLIAEHYPEYVSGLDGIKQYVIQEAEKHKLPSIWVHGDFNVKNILFSKDGKEITGLIDWDNAMDNGLPFVDLIHFLSCKHRYIERIGVGEVVINMLQGEGFEPWEKDILNKYAECTMIDIEALSLAVIMYWITHVYLHCARNSMEKKGTWILANVIEPIQFIKTYGCRHGR